MLARSSSLAFLFATSVLFAAAACSSSDTTTPDGTTPTGTSGGVGSKCTTNDQCTAGKETCDTATGACVAIAGGTEIGSGDGSPASVTLTEIYSTKSSKQELIDLAFNPKDPTEVWAVAYFDDSTHVGKGVTADSKGTWTQYHDPAAAHFMHKPPAIAMGEAPFWGVCGDNDNSQNDPRNEPNYFMGPAMMTSDLTIFSKPTKPEGDPSELGSHYDMLHNTTFCRGIAWQEANIYWAFNGQLGSIDKYNFNKPHEPGGDDHKDGEIYRYALGKVKGVDGIPSHVFYDESDKMLYIADTGNARIVKLDTTKGAMGKELPLRNEILKANGVMNDTDVEVVVSEGLEQPAGIEVKNNLIYVTDAATGFFHVFDKSGKEVRKLDTGLPKKSLAGFTFGPDGKIWFVDRNRSKVLRIDPGS